MRRRRNPPTPSGIRFWFHGTPHPDSVERHGLVLSKLGTGYGSESKPAEGGVYFTKLLSQAVSAAYWSGRDPETRRPILLRRGVFCVDIGELDVEVDEDWRHGLSNHGWDGIPCVRVLGRAISKSRFVWWCKWDEPKNDKKTGNLAEPFVIRFYGPSRPRDLQVEAILREIVERYELHYERPEMVKVEFR